MKINRNRKSAFKLVVVNFTICPSSRPSHCVRLSIYLEMSSKRKLASEIDWRGFCPQIGFIYTRSICIWNIFFLEASRTYANKYAVQLTCKFIQNGRQWKLVRSEWTPLIGVCGNRRRQRIGRANLYEKEKKEDEIQIGNFKIC